MDSFQIARQVDTTLLGAYDRKTARNGLNKREKRLKGLEPSTFCMASRRSSQLSYSRNGGGQVYRGRRFAEPPSGVLDLLALLHIQPLQQLQQPRDMVLLVVDDPLHGLLRVLVRQREGLLLEAVDREQLV